MLSSENSIFFLKVYHTQVPASAMLPLLINRKLISTANFVNTFQWTPQETMAMRRCRNRSNDLIHGGWWWWWWWRFNGRTRTHKMWHIDVIIMHRLFYKKKGRVKDQAQQDYPLVPLHDPHTSHIRFPSSPTRTR